MKSPALWILGACAAGITIAERWPAAPKLWAVAAGLGILGGGILCVAGCGCVVLCARGVGRDWRIGCKR
jgi:hypothetical protein